MSILRAFLILALGSPVTAQELRLPSNAELTFEDVQAGKGDQFPVGVWDGTNVPTKLVSGDRVQRAWRIDASGLTSEQIIRSIREQLANARFNTLVDCVDRTCGGFDFRFALDVAPPPHMQVNLADFRFLSAARDEAGIMVLASRTRDAGYLHIVQVGAAEPVASTDGATLQGSTTAPVSTTLSDQLDQHGHAVLVGLEFERGSAQLGRGPFSALNELAALLSARPSLKVALVGHTDSEGSLDGNIALSKRRAGSVLERLASELGVDRRQMEAQGMGYLSPVASNLTPEGREANRRVEVIITSIEN